MATNENSVRTIDAGSARYSLLTLLLLSPAAGVLGVGAVSPTTELPAGYAVTEGESMRPTWGDTAFLVYVDAGAVESGDPIVYRVRSGKYEYWVSHRAVQHTPKGWVTRGDNEPWADQLGPHSGFPHATEQRIAGEVVLAISPRGGVDVWWPW